MTDSGDAHKVIHPVSYLIPTHHSYTPTTASDSGGTAHVHSSLSVIHHPTSNLAVCVRADIRVIRVRRHDPSGQSYRANNISVKGTCPISIGTST